MSIESSSLANLANVAYQRQDKSASIKIEKNIPADEPQTIKVDAEDVERQSLKAEPSVEGRKSVAALVNEKKDSVGLKLDISV